MPNPLVSGFISDLVQHTRDVFKDKSPKRNWQCRNKRPRVDSVLLAAAGLPPDAAASLEPKPPKSAKAQPQTRHHRGPNCLKDIDLETSTPPRTGHNSGACQLCEFGQIRLWKIEDGCCPCECGAYVVCHFLCISG